jgi:hypothetical protein
VLRGVAGHENVQAHIAIADFTYKFTGEVALKTEFQGMFTKQDEGNWGLGLLELTIPSWFFTVFDNWNYGNPMQIIVLTILMLVLDMLTVAQEFSLLMAKLAQE